MAASKLKRLTGRRKAFRAFVEDLAAMADGPISLVDADGTLRFGPEPPEGQSGSPIWGGAEQVGWVYGGDDAPKVAEMLGRLVTMDTEKRSVAREGLDRYKELNLLYGLAERLMENPGSSGIATTTLTEARAVAASDGGVVLLLTGTTGAPPVAVAEFGEPYLPPDHGWADPSSIVQRVLQRCSPELIDDLSETEGDKANGVRSLLCVPIKTRSCTLGVLLLSSHTPGAYSSGTLKLVYSLAGQAAPAIECSRLAESFARFVPAQFLRALGRESVLEVTRGEYAAKEMSILFSDVRDFTTIAEGHTPEESFRFINEYLSYMEPPIRRRGGFIDSYAGDAFMALFDKVGADEAIDAAIGNRLALEEYNRRRAARGEIPVRAGIGISTGPIMLGTIGAEKRLACSVIGDVVNTASRVESLTKSYGAGILISNFTFERLSNPEKYRTRRVDRVRLKGKTIPVTVYEVLDGMPDEELDRRLNALAKFEKGWSLYQEGRPGDALAAFARAEQIDPGDDLTRLFMDRCHLHLSAGVPEDWDGVTVLRTK